MKTTANKDKCVWPGVYTCKIMSGIKNREFFDDFSFNLSVEIPQIPVLLFKLIESNYRTCLKSLIIC